MLFNMASLFFGVGLLMNEFIGTTLTILYLGGHGFSLMANDFILLMIHLSYYSIAHYIRLLRAKINSGGFTTTDEVSPWKGIKQIIFYLQRASTALNSMYSFAALYIITTKFIIVSLHLFFSIYGLVQPSEILYTSHKINMMGQVITSLVHVLIVLHAADLPIHQVAYYLKRDVVNSFDSV